MIKRSFFSLSGPGFNYDTVEPDLKEPTSIPIPPKLILLVNEPVNPGKKALIKAKSKVTKGQKLCLYSESTEYTVSPISGKIKAVESYSDNIGNLSTYIVISDEKDDKSSSKKSKKSSEKSGASDKLKASDKPDDSKESGDPEEISYDLDESLTSADEFLRMLPGAPPLKQLAAGEGKIDTIVISGVDTDLLSTTRQYVTLKFFDELKKGALLLQKISRASKVFLAIPATLNLPETADTLQVIKISEKYPSALPALILKDHLNMILPQGKSPEDLGVCFVSAEAAVSLARAYKAKTAVFEKILTVIGKGGKAYRVKASIGTPMSRIFKVLRIQLNDQDRLIIGGPMRGFATYTVHHPVEASMDTVIVQKQMKITEVSDSACINCGKCIQICPAQVPVNMLVRNLEIAKYEEAADFYDLFSCIECGLCTYVCTAQIPLFQHILLGKHKLLNFKADAEIGDCK